MKTDIELTWKSLLATAVLAFVGATVTYYTPLLLTKGHNYVAKLKNRNNSTKNFNKN